MNPGHSAKGCANRPTCQICKKQHATILHGRTFKKKEEKDGNKGEAKQGNKVPLAPFRSNEDAAAAAPTPSSTASAAATESPSVISPNATA